MHQSKGMRISIFGTLWATPAETQADSLIYRLRHMPERVPTSLRTAHVLRVLSVMSHRPVSRDWLLRHSKLKASVLDDLLGLLDEHGDLEIVDISGFAPAL